MSDNELNFLLASLDKYTRYCSAADLSELIYRRIHAGLLRLVTNHSVSTVHIYCLRIYRNLLRAKDVFDTVEVESKLKQTFVAAVIEDCGR